MLVFRSGGSCGTTSFGKKWNSFYLASSSMFPFNRLKTAGHFFSIETFKALWLLHYLICMSSS